MKVIGIIIAAMLVSLVTGLIFAWPVMIMFGVTHGFDARIPAFGFWTTLFLGSSLRMLLGTGSVDTDL